MLRCSGELIIYSLADGERKRLNQANGRGLNDSPCWSLPFRVMTQDGPVVTARCTLTGGTRKISGRKVKRIPPGMPPELMQFADMSLARQLGIPSEDVRDLEAHVSSCAKEATSCECIERDG
eukprot:Lankesteria_metandrocarpae@DN2142_c0_g1_i1.p1